MNKVITLFILLFTVILFSETKIEKLTSDSLAIDRIMWRIQSPDVKNNLKSILSDISREKAILRPYPIYFFKQDVKTRKYFQSHSSEMSVDQLVDTLKFIMDKSIILRVNKVDFTRLGMSEFNYGFDNDYVNLHLYPEFKDPIKLRLILLETVLSHSRKSSIEWIWGKSPENDAYYSTKLTSFNGVFTIYPDYRTYIGLDTFRDENSWFYSLTDYIEKRKQPLEIATSSENIITDNNESNQNKIEDTPQKIANNTEEKNTEEEKSEVVLNDFSMLTTFFKYNDETLSHKVNFSEEMESSEIVDSLLNYVNKSKVALLSKEDYRIYYGTDYSENRNHETGDAKKKDGLRRLLKKSYDNPESRHSIEWAVEKDKDNRHYYSVLLTAYKKSITVFESYKKVAPKKVRDDKESWYYRLPEKD